MQKKVYNKTHTKSTALVVCKIICKFKTFIRYCRAFAQPTELT
jgi:hypothetical protein